MKTKNKETAKTDSNKAIRQLDGFMVDSNYPQMIHQTRHRSKSLTHTPQPNNFLREYFVNPYQRFSVHNKENEILDLNRQQNEIIEEINEEDKEIPKNKILQSMPQLKKEKDLPIQTVQFKDEDMFLSQKLKNLKIIEMPNEDLKNPTIEEVNEVREKDFELTQHLEHSPRIKLVTDIIEDSYLNDNTNSPDTNYHYMHSIHTGLDKLTDNGRDFTERSSEVDNDDDKFFLVKIHNYKENSHRIVPVVDKVEDSMIGNINNLQSNLILNFSHSYTPSLKYLPEGNIKEEISSKEEEQNIIKNINLEESKLIVDEVDEKEGLKKTSFLGWENIKDFSKIEEKDEFSL